MVKHTKITAGMMVKHSVPSMMYHQSGLVLEGSATRYGNRYIQILFKNPETGKVFKTWFWDAVLIPL